MSCPVSMTSQTGARALFDSLRFVLGVLSGPGPADTPLADLLAPAGTATVTTTCGEPEGQARWQRIGG
jgi:hypothetical protein